MVPEPIVKPQKSQVQLVYEQVYVVAEVTDQGYALAVAGQIVSLPEKQLVRVLRVVHERVTDRTVAVEALEVEPRRARVAEVLDRRITAKRRSFDVKSGNTWPRTAYLPGCACYQAPRIL